MLPEKLSPEGEYNPPEEGLKCTAKREKTLSQRRSICAQFHPRVPGIYSNARFGILSGLVYTRAFYDSTV